VWAPVVRPRQQRQGARPRVSSSRVSRRLLGSRVPASRFVAFPNFRPWVGPRAPPFPTYSFPACTATSHYLPTPRQNCAILATYFSFHIISMLRDPHPHPNMPPLSTYPFFSALSCAVLHPIPFRFRSLSPSPSPSLRLCSSLARRARQNCRPTASRRIARSWRIILYVFAWISSYLTPHPSTLSWSYRRSPISHLPHPPFF
jgi:hypothetical protein